MSRIRVRNETQAAAQEHRSDGFYVANALSSYGTKIELDGREVRAVRSMTLAIKIDEVVKSNIEIIACDDLDIEINADVTVQLFATDANSEIEATASPDGTTTRYRIVPRWREEQ